MANFRLSKVAIDFNLSLDEIIIYLLEEGILIERNPNAKISEVAYELIKIKSKEKITTPLVELNEVEFIDESIVFLFNPSLLEKNEVYGVTLQQVQNKLSKIDISSQEVIGELINWMYLINDNDQINLLCKLINEKILDDINNLDYSKVNEYSFNGFEIYTQTLQTFEKDLNFENNFDQFNKNIREDVKFRLWQLTKYFNPDIEFFLNNIYKLSAEEFHEAPLDSHRKYFEDLLSDYKNFESKESFAFFVFIAFNSRSTVVSEFLYRLPDVFQIAIWLVLSKTEMVFRKGLSYNFTFLKINLTTEFIINYLNKTSSLEKLVESVEMINYIKGIQNDDYNSPRNITSYTLGSIDKVGIRSLFKKIDFSRIQYKKVEFLSIFYNLITQINKDRLELFKVCVPKFIERNRLDFKVLSTLFNTIKLDDKSVRQIISYLNENNTAYQRVLLWFNGYTNEVVFDEIFDVFREFDFKEQPKLLRKTFTLLGKDGINSNDTFFLRSNELLLQKDLNLNVQICLIVLNELHSNRSYIQENLISETICNSVGERVSKLIQIDNLFENCKGRTNYKTVSKKTYSWYVNIAGKNFLVEDDLIFLNDKIYSIDKQSNTVYIDGFTYPFKWKKVENNFRKHLEKKPKGITFCDAINTHENEYSEVVFHWCCNNKCFEPCQSDNISLEWTKFTLRDFIKIMKLPFESDKYYRFLSLINRSNRLLQKLQCKNCDFLLRDSKTSEFAFYRVTTFRCTNPLCSDSIENRKVYLNHCFNWKCNNVIDSRISNKCPNGWYICDSCSCCCSQEKLQTRLKNLIVNNNFNFDNPRHSQLKYQVENKLGHLDSGVQFDYETGFPKSK